MVLSPLHLFIIFSKKLCPHNFCQIYTYEVLCKNGECFKIETVDAMSIIGHLCNAATKLASTFLSVTHTEEWPDSIRQSLKITAMFVPFTGLILFACTRASYIALQLTNTSESARHLQNKLFCTRFANATI